MKANQKFLNNDDEAVSPVIAVILMVAITVVLAATVYVWVSGFGQSGSQAKNLSLSQSSCTANTNSKFLVVSVSPNFAFSALKVTDATSGKATATGGGAASATLMGMATSGSTNLAAGDILTFTPDTTSNTLACTDTYNFIDTASNSVVATLTLHA